MRWFAFRILCVTCLISFILSDDILSSHLGDRWTASYFDQESGTLALGSRRGFWRVVQSPESDSPVFSHSIGEGRLFRPVRIRSIVLNMESRLLCMGGDTFSLECWNLQPVAVFRNFSASSLELSLYSKASLHAKSIREHVFALAFLPLPPEEASSASSLLAVGSGGWESGTLSIINISKSHSHSHDNVLYSLSRPFTKWVTSLSFSSQGRLLVGCANGQVHLFTVSWPLSSPSLFREMDHGSLSSPFHQYHASLIHPDIAMVRRLVVSPLALLSTTLGGSPHLLVQAGWVSNDHCHSHSHRKSNSNMDSATKNYSRSSMEDHSNSVSVDVDDDILLTTTAGEVLRLGWREGKGKGIGKGDHQPGWELVWKWVPKEQAPPYIAMHNGCLLSFEGNVLCEEKQAWLVGTTGCTWSVAIYPPYTVVCGSGVLSLPSLGNVPFPKGESPVRLAIETEHLVRPL